MTEFWQRTTESVRNRFLPAIEIRIQPLQRQPMRTYLVRMSCRSCRCCRACPERLRPTAKRWPVSNEFHGSQQTHHVILEAGCRLAQVLEERHGRATSGRPGPRLRRGQELRPERLACALRAVSTTQKPAQPRVQRSVVLQRRGGSECDAGHEQQLWQARTRDDERLDRSVSSVVNVETTVNAPAGQLQGKF